MREDVAIHNYGEEPAFCGIELDVDCDFADLFEVKEGRVEKSGELTVDREGSSHMFTYTRGSFRRGTRIDFSREPNVDGRVASFEFIVPPRDEWTLCVQVTPVVDTEEITPRYLCGVPVEHATPNARLESWRANLPRLTTEHDSFGDLLARSTRISRHYACSTPSSPTAPSSPRAPRGS